MTMGRKLPDEKNQMGGYKKVKKVAQSNVEAKSIKMKQGFDN